ncbi:MAG: 3-hydroxyacyl-CoA dehydrogenase NAD-binding domain-containing protein [Rhodospirillales bacterium]|nr:3-hydroxyacyl-CoA dehydrogenase NAD-binding domain-containing protein [Rhodospirillales bacterium]MCW8861347.1 3-hydroxyacyl-CoA dehydrogenase NAD-binding domain-containing protein [Rhodospirillales bacterium]MCW8951731.1 3-hydroxyacyl-CoA dehydrogenase NAD-binding domain-containing protein [Rhodospirillales bacterium]MCW8971546.1 3-hydroxyacyl-CoA dehydrogenase NAD-binding domain-containing protein [Rhodospirillales bacterium]MCW9003491.1 3-hydroxyacyl-CoA dehydrogenase NAD-binding domain-c
MMTMGMFTTTIDDDGIATVVWDTPGRPVNVINEESTPAFAKAIRAVVDDEAVKGVILASGKSDFVVGADLEMFLAMGDDHQAILDFIYRFHAVMRAMETSGKPFVAALNGTALGGGLEVAFGCHHRIAADNPKARFGLPEATLGLLPGGGGTQRLSRMIGAREALPLMMEGRRLGAADALKIGIIDEVVPAERLLAAAKGWILANPNAVQPWDIKGYRIPGGAVQSPKGLETFMAGEAMLRKKTWGNYRAQQLILQSVYEGLQVPIDTGTKIEGRYLTELLLSAETRAMIRTLFFGMQDANKLKTRPEGVAKASYAKVGILGAGMMGAGVAYATAKAGIETVLLDTARDVAEKGKGYSAALLDKQVAKGRLTTEKRDAFLSRITPTDDYADLAGCDLVIEAVFEDRDIKADVTQKTEAVIAADAVFASNTSTLPITGLAEASARPENFIGLHFFSPVDKMPLVEIIVGEKTSKETLARSMDYVQAIGKTPIVVNDSRGFYTSRVFATYLKEGVALLAEGVSPALIENAGRMAGMPVGPLAVGDEVSISLIHHIKAQTMADLGDAYEPHPADAVIDLFVEDLNRPGKKAGKGFYDYPEGGKKSLWPGLAEHFPVADEQPDVETVKRRLTFIQGIETARCMEENVLTSAQDADIGSILGWGFAPFRGGVISNIDIVGVENFVRECDAMAQKHGARFAPPQLLRDMAEKGEAFYGC